MSLRNNEEEGQIWIQDQRRILKTEMFLKMLKCLYQHLRIKYRCVLCVYQIH